MLSTGPEDMIEDGQHGGTTEGEVTPFVRRSHQGANETGHDHDCSQEHGEQDGRPGNSGRQQEGQDDQGSCNEPVDVANIENLSEETGDFRVATNKLNGDGGPSQVGGLGEIRDGRDESDAGDDIMEQSMTTGSGETHSVEDQSGDGHESADGPIPIGTTNGDGDISRNTLGSIAIDANRIVCHFVFFDEFEMDSSKMGDTFE